MQAGGVKMTKKKLRWELAKVRLTNKEHNFRSCVEK